MNGDPAFPSGAGSVMGQMRALFTPPGRDSKRHQHYEELAGTTVELHPYYRRPGKGHNHDCCDACGEGGDLICCDNCPASFHFSCHAPPMEEEDIPQGDWMCLRCYVREKSRLDAIKAANLCNVILPSTSATSDNTSGVATPSSSNGASPAVAANSESEDNDNPTPGASTASTPSKGGKESSRSSRASGRNSRSVKKQMEVVIKHEKEKAFKLYKIKYDKYLEVKPSTNSPFDALIAATQVTNAEQYKLPEALETKEDLPFSWKWSEEQQRVDSNAAKTCTGCMKRNRKMPAVACDFCPNIYHLDCLDPPLCEVPRERWMCPQHVEHHLDSKVLGSTRLTERLKLWNKYAKMPVDTETVRLNFFRKVRTGKLYQRSRVRKVPLESRCKVPSYIKDQYRQPLPGIPADGAYQPSARNIQSDGTSDEFLANLISMQTNFVEIGGAEALKGMQDRVQASRDLRKSRRKAKKEAKKEALEKNAEDEEKKKENEVKENGVAKEDKEETAPKPPKQVDEDEDTDSDCSLSFDSEDDEENSPLSEELQAQLTQYLSHNLHSGSLKNLTKPVRDLLAVQRLQELFPAKPKVDLSCAVQARACLIPMHSSKPPSLMKYRSLEIGIGSSELQLDLSSLGHCNYVSNKHASIYFDQYSQVYELINYSEHGTVVDNAVYALEYDYKVVSARTVSRKRKKLGTRGDDDALHTMSDRSGWTPCHCEASAAQMLTKQEGCEGSAVLKHGSYIRMGCFQFVFSIMDFEGGISLEEMRQREKDEKEERKSKKQPDVEAAAATATVNGTAEVKSDKEESNNKDKKSRKKKVVLASSETIMDPEGGGATGNGPKQK